jgi:hypothetical protein
VVTERGEEAGLEEVSVEVRPRAHRTRRAVAGEERADALRGSHRGALALAAATHEGQGAHLSFDALLSVSVSTCRCLCNTLLLDYRQYFIFYMQVSLLTFQIQIIFCGNGILCTTLKKSTVVSLP